MPGTARPLPRGRHGLSREEVAAAQRGRILRAMVDATAERGYVATSVADVIGRAGVSRETFYEQYDSKQDCFIAAYDFGVEVLLGRMAGALERGEGDPLERLGRMLHAYLQSIVAEPAAARAALIEVFAAGPEAIARRYELQERFVEAVASVLALRSKRDRFAAEALVAALSSMVTARLGTGDLGSVPALHAPVMELAGRLLASR